MNKLKVQWVVQNGSIFTKDSIVAIKIDATKLIRVQDSIAFNVGDTADHIVRLHNESLKHVELA